VNVVYVSYDGALDPLGASQVVPYVLGLAQRGVRFSLITFEKAERWSDSGTREALREQLEKAQVRWLPLAYHPRPRLFAKALDLCIGARAIRGAIRAMPGGIVHCRGDVPMAMARAGAPSTTPVLYDIRGFFSDERVEGGSWARGGLIDRSVRRLEAGNLARANGVVVLTKAAQRRLGATRTSLPPLRVIPTCVDLDRFRVATAAQRDFGVVYGGSLGSAYPSDAIVAFARAAARVMAAPALFLTPNEDEARRAGATPEWSDVRRVPPSEMPSWLARCRAAFCLYRPGPYLAATSPTKIGEALATGLPVAVNRGIGDLDAFIEESGVGTVIDEPTPQAFEATARRLHDLASDPGTPARCRRVAEERFGLDRGVESYLSLYRELLPDRPAD
jgi:glycosyltransferase involved in cell wall biosynthesis